MGHVSAKLKSVKALKATASSCNVRLYPFTSRYYSSIARSTRPMYIVLHRVSRKFFYQIERREMHDNAAY